MTGSSLAGTMTDNIIKRNEDIFNTEEKKDAIWQRDKMMWNKFDIDVFCSITWLHGDFIDFEKNETNQRFYP